MLAPRDTATRERKSLDGLWGFVADPDGVGRDQGWWRGLPAGRDRCRSRAATTTSSRTPPCTTTSATSGTSAGPGPGGWAGRADRAALRRRPPTVRWCGSNDRAVAARGRLHAVRGGRHRPRRPGRRDPPHRGRQQRADVAVDPAGLRRADCPTARRQRHYHDFFNYAGLHRSVWLYTTPRRTSTTSPS